jgi:hypothetical protein
LNTTTANLKRDLLIEDGFSGFQERPIRSLRLGHIGQFGGPGNTSGGLATFDDGSTLMLDRVFGRDNVTAINS